MGKKLNWLNLIIMPVQKLLALALALALDLILGRSH